MRYAAIFYVLLLTVLGIPNLVMAQGGPYCIFTPAGNPICGGPLDVFCPLCATPGLPRPNLDGQELAVKETIMDLKKQAVEVHQNINDISSKTKSLFGTPRPEAAFESDEHTKGMIFRKVPADANPNPEVDPTADVDTIVQQILNSQHIDSPNPPVEQQLAMREKLSRIGHKQLLLALAVADNNRFVMFDSENGESVDTKLKNALIQQTSNAMQENTVLSNLEARGAIMRALYAQKTRQTGLLGTMLATAALTEYASGSVDITKPTLYTPNNAQGDQEPGRPEVRNLLGVGSAISNAGLGVSTFSVGINQPAPVSNDQLVLQMRNFENPAQREPNEVFTNSIKSRASMMQKMHNDRVMVLLNQRAIKHMDDNIACHRFSMEQLDRVRESITPQLRQIGGAGFNQPATTSGPFAQSSIPLTHPDYPYQKTPLDLTFEAIAGRPARYEFNTQTRQVDTIIPEYRGKLMRLDSSNYYNDLTPNIETRHRQETAAACQVADSLMGGRTQIRQMESDLGPGEGIFSTPEMQSVHNLCVPKQLQYNYSTPDNSFTIYDMTYCLADSVRQTLAPVRASNPNCDVARYLGMNPINCIVPGDPCVYNIGGANYYTNARPGPPTGLLGKWLQAYKIERYWASARFGYRYTTTNDQGSQVIDYLGSEAFKFQTQQKIAELVERHRLMMKALNDADDRAAGGFGDTPKPTLDMSTPDGRFESMQFQLQQTQRINADLAEKMSRIADYDRRKAELTPPPEAPAEIQRQWSVYAHNMDLVKADILANKQKIDTFNAYAADIVDDRNAENIPNFNYQSNNCFIFREPRTVNANLEDNYQNLIDPATGVQYQAPISTDRIETQQRKCLKLEPIVPECNGVAWPTDNTIRVTPGLIDY